MSGTTDLERRFAAARPAVDDGERRLEALIAGRLFGPAHAEAARIGRFTLLERVGRGGMGEVFAAYDPVLDRKVALKLLRADTGRGERGELLREARAAARLAHPNVVSIHEVGEQDDGGVYVAMEFIEGVTLRAWLRERPAVEAILRVFVDAGRGLAAAHDAGVVHRDFKPENVLISRGDGGEPRVRVVDFGLARVDAAEDRASAPATDGAWMGTPAYMAPEQLLRRPLDGRADQFGFCVALHEALAGRHPFGADEPGATCERILARIVAGAPAGERSIPAWLRRIVRRGLAVEPAARHPSMHALVRELRATPARRRRRLLLAAGAALVVGSSTLTAVSGGLAGSPCAAVDDELRGVWDEPTRAAGRDAFLAAGPGNAGEVWQRLAPRLDDHALAWLVGRRRTCEVLRGATAARDEFLLRDACLQRRRVELGSLTALLRAPTAAVVQSAPTAVDQLTPLAVCDDVEGLRREASRVESPRELGAAEALRRELLDLGTRVRAGQAGEVAPRVVALTATARERAGALVVAEALHLRGLVEEARGDYDAAAASLEAAVHEAIAGRHDRLHAEAAVRLVWLHGVQRRRSDAAARWSGHADAALRAIGDDPRLRARLLDHRGAIAGLGRDFVTAERLHREALALHAGPGRADVELAMSTSNLGLTLLAQGRLAEAEATIEAALARYGEVLGPHHPTVATVLSNLGQAHLDAGRYERALATLHDALARKEQVLGRDHAALLSTLSNLGNAYSALGRSGEARAHYLRGLAIGEREFGPDSPRLESLLHNLAFEAWQLGAHAEVVGIAGRALAIQRRYYGDANPILAPTLELIARSQLELGRRDEAAATIARALALAAGGGLDPLARGSVVLSAAWIGRATGAAPAQVRRLAAEAGALLRAAPGVTPDQERELALLLAP